MKTIGFIGGMSWQSSAQYYRLINEETTRRLGGHHNARSVMVTVNFSEVEQLQHSSEWDQLGEILAVATRSVERGGADVVVLCTNTMHKLADSITGAVSIPLLHIADATAAAILNAGHKRVGLLGTKFTMEEPFYASRIQDNFGIEVIVPPDDSRQLIHDVIYDELCRGIIRPESRERYQKIIGELAASGAESVILGCTEIGLLISGEDSPLPVHDSTTLHAMAAVEFALA
jgi:aspartate racemase